MIEVSEMSAIIASSDGQVLESIRTQSAPESVRLSGHAVTNASIEAISGVHVKNLELIGCVELTDDALTRVSSWNSLEAADFSMSDGFTDIGINTLVALHHLRVLNLTSVWQLTDASMTALSRLANLTELNLDDCELITDRGLAALAQSNSIRSLTLGNSPKITAFGLTQLAHSRMPLEELTVGGQTLRGLSLETFAGSESLRKLVVTSSSRNTAAILEELSKIRPQLKIDVMSVI